MKFIAECEDISVMSDKKVTRQKFKKIRDEFSAEYINQESEKVIAKIKSLEFDWQNATVMAYKSIRGEINLDKLSEVIENKIYFPVIENGKVVAKSENFQLGSYGVSEPTIGEIAKDKIDVCFVPGIAFSENMQRIGFGKGYYDVFLQDFNGIKIGITYQEFLVQDILVDKFDIPMDMIITPTNIYVAPQK